MIQPTRVSFVINVMSILVLTAAPIAAEAATCAPCAAAQERCYGSCFSREDTGAVRGCLIGCDNTAAACSCDEPATLRSEDFVERFPWAGPAALAAACNSTTPCGTAYPSCATWSGYYDCGTPICGVGLNCGDCGGTPCGGPATRQVRERYRVCFNAQGQSCTEYQRMSFILNCGC